MTSPQTTDERIWQAALELFARQGFAGTTTRDIAEASALTPGSLYHYMGSKDDLLEQVMFGSMTGLLGASRALAAGSGEPISTIAGLVRLHVAVHAKHRFEAKVVDSEVEQLGEANRKKIATMRDKYEILWRSTITDGVDRGVFHVDDQRLAGLALLGMCTEVANWYRPRGRMTPEVLGLQFADMSLALLRTTGPDGRPITIADVTSPDPAPYLATYEERGGYGMVGAKATSRSGS
ncbi:MAG: TetR/AcrR family transcriptional regulator [Nocardioides sp.]|jgi:AcrR family transcriptional regulator